MFADRRRCVFLLVVSLAACRVTDPLYCDDKKPCTDPDRPFCDLNGEHPASDGIGRTCIPDPDPDGGDPDGGPGAEPGVDAGFCAAGEFVQCSDDDSAIYCNEQGTAHVTVDCGDECNPDEQGCRCEPETSICMDNKTIRCGSAGLVEEIETCALGCDVGGERCTDVDPSNGLATYLDLTDDAPAIVLLDGAIIDTDAGTIENGDGSLLDVPEFQIPAPSEGLPVRILAVKSIEFGDTRIRGTQALAIVSDGDVIVHGHVRIEAGQVTEGACVGAGGTCMGLVCGGQGGGGFGAAGGDGGQASADACNGAAGSGGSASGNASLVPLRGGCPGGGDGGGALQLVSRTLILVEDGLGDDFLNAGGKAGANPGPSGGSGGGILLEAPRVVVSTGTGLVANGAGGQGGVPCAPGDGEDGGLDGLPAAGGTCTASEAAAGGAGGAELEAARDGGSVSAKLGCNSFIRGGGGGGSVGRIRVNVPVSADFSDSGVSRPDPSVGVLGTR